MRDVVTCGPGIDRVHADATTPSRPTARGCAGPDGLLESILGKHRAMYIGLGTLLIIIILLIIFVF